MNKIKSKAISSVLSALFVMLLMALPFNLKAQGKVMIGDCNGDVAITSTIGVNNAADGIEAASMLPSSLFEKYEDAELLGVNVGLASRLNVAEITVWVRESLDGANIFEASMTKEDGIKSGWNNVYGQRTPLPAGKNLYVGYTLKLSGASYPVSAVGEGREEGFLMNVGGEWKDMTAEGYGNLSIEIIATASNLVACDLALKQVSMPESVKIGSTVPMILKIQNIGVEAVDIFSVECSIEGYEPILYDVEQTIEPNEYADVNLDFVSPMNEKSSDVELKVSIVSIKNNEDADMSNNTLTTHFSSNRFEFVKRLLMEEFTNEQCTYCPRAAVSLHDLMSEPEFEDKILAICHHVGFSVDWLTLPVSSNYLWFYNGGTGSTYAPAFMYDRYSFDNSSPVNNGTDDYSSIKQKAAERLAEQPMTALEAKAEYDPETSRLNVHVEGERLPGYEGNRLTICIVENNITAHHQMGVTGEFIHQHVARDINEIWGAEIEWDSDSFSHDTSFYYNPSWVRDNVQVLAFISNYDSTNYKNCCIDNAVAAELNLGEAGINDVDAEDTSASAEYFTLSGLRVERPSEGLYIVKRGEKVTKEYLRNN